MNRLAERDRQLRRRAPVGLRFEQLAQRNRLAGVVRNLDADGGLAGNAIDQHRLGLHREAEIVGEAGDLGVLHAGVRLELERGDDRARVNLHDAALDRELAALLLEQPRAVHQLALVDLALGLRRVEQRDRRQRVVALAALGRRLRRRLGIGQRQRRRDDLRRLGRRERLRAAGRHGRGGRGAAVRACRSPREGSGQRVLRPAGRRVGAARSWRPGRSRPRDRRGRPRRRRLGERGRRGGAFLRVLGDHLAALLLAPPLLAPFAERVDAAADAAVRSRRSARRRSGRTRTAST